MRIAFRSDDCVDDMRTLLVYSTGRVLICDVKRLRT